MRIQSSPITGKDALMAQLALSGFRNGDQVWIKVANNRIHKGLVTLNGLSVWECAKAKDKQGNPIEDERGTVWQTTQRFHPDGFAYLTNKAKNGESIFFIPNHPRDGISNNHVTKFKCIWIEIDNLSIDDQWERINAIADRFNITPSFIVHSGGKSLQTYFAFDQFITDPDHWQRLQRKLIILFNSDKVIQNFNREMRLAGFPRVKPETQKITHQLLEYKNDRVYSPQEIESLLDATGLFPHGLTGDRWSDWRSHIQKIEKSGTTPINDLQSWHKHSFDVLALPEDELPSIVQQRARKLALEARSQVNLSQVRTDSTNWVDLVAEAEDRLGFAAFNWSGHNWNFSSANHARGNCPFHDSKSGTSAWAAPMKVGRASQVGFGCMTCTQNRQISAFSYWLALRNGGLDAPFPKGLEYIKLAKEFCDEAGIITPEINLNKWDGYVDPEHGKVIHFEEWQQIKEGKKQAFLEKVKDTQKKLNANSHNLIEIHQRYLDVDPYPTTIERYAIAISGIFEFISGMGTGKTVQVKKIVSENQLRGVKTILIAPRNSILRQACKRTGIYHQFELIIPGDAVRTEWMIANTATIAMCPDSFLKLNPQDFVGATIIIDEAESSIAHMLVGGTCKAKRAKILTRFHELIHTAIATGGRVILMDAHLSDIPGDYIQSLAPEGTPITGIKNTWKPDQGWNVFFYNGSIDEGLNEKINDKSGIVKLLKDMCDSGEKIAIAVDNQLMAEGLQKILYEDQCFRVDSNTLRTNKQAQDFVDDPNLWLQRHKDEYPHLVYTPTMECGNSIDEPHYTKVIGIFTGVIPTKNQMQMLGRVRANCDRHVFTVTHSNFGDDDSRFLPEDIQRNLLHYHDTNNLLIKMSEQWGESEDPTDAQRLAKLQNWIDPEYGCIKALHLDPICKIKARDNYSKANLRVELLKTLKESGHSVTETTAKYDHETKIEVKETNKEILHFRAESILEAKDISLDEARYIREKDNATDEELAQAYRALLMDELPGIELTIDLILKCSVRSGGKWLYYLKTEWMIRYGLDQGIQQKLDLKQWQWHLDQDFVSISDVRARTLQLKALKNLIYDAGLFDVGRTFNPDDKFTKDYIRNVSRNHRHNLKYLGLSLGKNTDPIAFIKKLLGRIGAPLEKLNKRDKEDKTFIISQRFLNDPDRGDVFAAIARKMAIIVGDNAIESEGVSLTSEVVEEVAANDAIAVAPSVAEITNVVSNPGQYQYKYLDNWIDATVVSWQDSPSFHVVVEVKVGDRTIQANAWHPAQIREVETAIASVS